MIQPTITLHLAYGQCIEINPKYIVDYCDRTDKNGNVIGSWLSTTNRELSDSLQIKESSEEIKKIIDKHNTESALIYVALDTINCTLIEIQKMMR